MRSKLRIERDNYGIIWIQVGSSLAAVAVVMGAFAAHGLGNYLTLLYGVETRETLAGKIPAAAKYLEDFKTAADYQMIHSLGLIALGIAAPRLSTRYRKIAAISLLLGIVFFSGSLYALVLSGVTALGAITPIGGILFTVGWIAFALAIKPMEQSSESGISIE